MHFTALFVYFEVTQRRLKVVNTLTFFFEAEVIYKVLVTLHWSNAC